MAPPACETRAGTPRRSLPEIAWSRPAPAARRPADPRNTRPRSPDTRPPSARPPFKHDRPPRPRGSAPRPDTPAPMAAPPRPMLDRGSHQPIPHPVACRIDPERGVRQDPPRLRTEQLHVGPGTIPHCPGRTAVRVPPEPRTPRHRPLAGFSHRQPVPRPHHPPLHPPEPCREIRRPAPKHRRDVDPARHCDIQKPPAHEPRDDQLTPGLCALAPMHRHRRAVEGRLHPGARQRETRRTDPTRSVRRSSPIPVRGADVVPHERVGDGMRPAVHRPATGHALRAMPGRPCILHRQIRRRRHDLDRRGTLRATHPSTRTKRTRSPAAKTAGGSRIGSNRPADRVRPMRCHPPGIAYGYTPVCAPAIATDPAWTVALAPVRRGTTSAGSSSPKVRPTRVLKIPGNTRYTLRALAARSRPPRSTPSGAPRPRRSGPSYRTGMVCSRPPGRRCGPARARRPAAATIGSARPPLPHSPCAARRTIRSPPRSRTRCRAPAATLPPGYRRRRPHHAGTRHRVGPITQRDRERAVGERTEDRRRRPLDLPTRMLTAQTTRRALRDDRRA